MPGKTDFLFLACCAAWLFCLPVFAVLGVIALLGYALFCLVTDCFASAAPELANAREVAQHLCFDKDVRRLS
jgi:hypothetical protein